MASVTLENLVKVYGRDIAVRGIDLDVPDRQLTVLVCPSGCGKSTTLRMRDAHHRCEDRTLGRELKVPGRKLHGRLPPDTRTSHNPAPYDTQPSV